MIEAERERPELRAVFKDGVQADGVHGREEGEVDERGERPRAACGENLSKKGEMAEGLGVDLGGVHYMVGAVYVYIGNVVVIAGNEEKGL